MPASPSWALVRLRCLRLVLGLLIACGAVGCKSAPTEPAFDELAGIYTGRWRGMINGLAVVLDVRAEQGSAERWVPVGLGGTGVAVDPATGESHNLTILGQTTGPNTTWFGLSIAMVTGPGGVILSGGQGTGQFHGGVAADRRTWPGRFTSSAANDFDVPIFGRGEYAVTFSKD